MMQIRNWKTLAKSSVLMVLLALQYQNCSSYSDPSPFELGSEGVPNIPASKVVLGAPNDPSYLDRRVENAVFSIQMDGVCNVGTAASDHYIELSLARFDGASYIDTAWPSANCDINNPVSTCIRNVKCEHGRYHILFSGQRADFCPTNNPQGIDLRLRGQLVTIDSNGEETRARGATMERGFGFARLTSICPY